MTTPLWIWAIFHALGLVGSFWSDPQIRMVKICMMLASLMIGLVTLGTGHTNVFLLVTMPAVIITFLSLILSLAVKPPNNDNEKIAGEHAMEGTIRLAVILACWVTAL